MLFSASYGVVEDHLGGDIYHGTPEALFVE
jgi:hypothetical protein